MKDMINPTGSSPRGVTVRPTRSARRTTAAPKAIDAGTRNLLSAPMIILTTCGAMSPTNAMIPVKLITPPTTRDRITRQTSLYFDASSPRLFALSSPRVRTLSLFEVRIRNIEPITVTTSISGICDQTAFSKDPICQM